MCLLRISISREHLSSLIYHSITNFYLVIELFILYKDLSKSSLFLKALEKDIKPEY